MSDRVGSLRSCVHFVTFPFLRSGEAIVRSPAAGCILIKKSQYERFVGQFASDANCRRVAHDEFADPREFSEDTLSLNTSKATAGAPTLQT